MLDGRWAQRKAGNPIGVCHVTSVEFKQVAFRLPGGFMQIGKLEVSERSRLSRNITTSTINKKKTARDELLTSFCNHDGCRNAVSPVRGRILWTA